MKVHVCTSALYPYNHAHSTSTQKCYICFTITAVQNLLISTITSSTLSKINSTPWNWKLPISIASHYSSVLFILYLFIFSTLIIGTSLDIRSISTCQYPLIFPTPPWSNDPMQAQGKKNSPFYFVQPFSVAIFIFCN